MKNIIFIDESVKGQISENLTDSDLESENKFKSEALLFIGKNLNKIKIPLINYGNRRFRFSYIYNFCFEWKI